MTRSSSGTLPAQSEAPETSTALAAMGLSAILWERENRLHEAEAVLRKSLGAHMQHGENERRWKKIRSAASTISTFLATKADHIEVKKKRFGASVFYLLKIESPLKKS